MNVPNAGTQLGLAGVLGPGPAGAKSVGPLVFLWDTLGSQPINLRQQQTQTNLIDQVQSLYIDNSGNTGALTLSLANGQVIIWPAKFQGYIPILIGTPVQFSASSVVAANQKSNVFLLNYQVDAIMWAVA